MAGLSIKRRRRAWLRGVAYGASGKGKCRLILAKLKEIFQRGLLFGKMHADTPYVQAVVDQERRKYSPRRSVAETPRRSRIRGEGLGPRPRATRWEPR
jgi:hypothetical protein